MANVLIIVNDSQPDWQNSLDKIIGDLTVGFYTLGSTDLAVAVFQKAQTFFSNYPNVSLIKILNPSAAILNYLKGKLKDNGTQFHDGFSNIVAFTVSTASDTVVDFITSDDDGATDKMTIFKAYSDALNFDH